MPTRRRLPEFRGPALTFDEYFNLYPPQEPEMPPTSAPTASDTVLERDALRYATRLMVKALPSDRDDFEDDTRPKRFHKFIRDINRYSTGWRTRSHVPTSTQPGENFWDLVWQYGEAYTIWVEMQEQDDVTTTLQAQVEGGEFANVQEASQAFYEKASNLTAASEATLAKIAKETFNVEL